MQVGIRPLHTPSPGAAAMVHGDPMSRPSRESLHNAALLAWILYAVGLFTGGLATFIGWIIALVKRGDAAGTVYDSHFAALVRCGVWLVVLYAVGWLTVWILIGWVILLGAWVYNLVVVVKGILALSNRQPYS